MVDPTDKDTKHIKDQRKRMKNGKVNQLDVRNKKDQQNNYKTKTWVSSFVIIVLVFLVPHIKMVYFALSILFTK